MKRKHLLAMGKRYLKACVRARLCITTVVVLKTLVTIHKVTGRRCFDSFRHQTIISSIPLDNNYFLNLLSSRGTSLKGLIF